MAFDNLGVMVPPSDAADAPAENFDRVTAIKPSAGCGTCMKYELRPRGIRINAVCAGTIGTRMVPP